MSRRLLAAGLLPLLLTAGCLEEQRGRQLATAGPPPPPPRRPDRPVGRPATEETARRVLAVGQAVIAANPQVGMRPVFATVGAPHAEIFHTGGALENSQVFVSEGLVKRCKTDAELAALLCLELGKIVAEREAMAGASPRPADKRLPPVEAIGTDSGGTFGPPDGTRQMELAKYDKARRAAPARPLDPEVLARGYLTKAGFEAAVLQDVAPLVREAEQNLVVEKGFSERKSDS